MPISVSDILNERRHLKIKLPSGELAIIYKPNVMTPAREDLLIREARDANTLSMPTLELYEELVVDQDLWGPLYSKDRYEDVVDEDGNKTQVFVKGGELIVPEGEKVLPIPAHMMHFSTRITDLILTRIREDMSADPKESSQGSVATSSTRR